MIMMAVSENQVFELILRPAKLADGPEQRCLGTGETGIDQRQALAP